MNEKFPDGESYILEQGNRNTTAEIFTPPNIVNEMINNLGIFNKVGFINKVGFYRFNKDLKEEDLLNCIKSKCYEMCVGTGNIISTILVYKLKCVSRLIAVNNKINNKTNTKNKTNNKNSKDDLILTAITSIYANDISKDNVTHTIDRLLKQVPDTLKDKAEKILQTNIVELDCLGEDGLSEEFLNHEWTFYNYSNDNYNPDDSYKVTNKDIKDSVMNMQILKSFIPNCDTIENQMLDESKDESNKSSKPQDESDDKLFDFLISNPPYHYSIGRRKIPIYHEFIEMGNQISKRATYITESGFIKGGQQLDKFREYLIKEKHLKKVVFHLDNVFPGVEVKAAITIFNNTKEYDKVEKVLFLENGQIDKYEPKILNWDYKSVKENKLKKQVEHIYENISKNKKNMSELIPGWSPFGLNSKSFKENKNKFSREVERERERDFSI